MSNNNNDGGAIGALGLVVACLYLLAIIAYAIAFFLAVIFTIMAFLAWDRPLRLFGKTICSPLEARIFIAGGIAGAIGVPAFAIFCSLLFEVHIPDGAWFYLITGGYSFASLFAIGKAAEAYPDGLPADMDGPVIDHIPVATPIAPPRPSEPFRYADWNDEADQAPEEKPACGGCEMSRMFPHDPKLPVFRI